jgi:hypothetical protein
VKTLRGAGIAGAAVTCLLALLVFVVLALPDSSRDVVLALGAAVCCLLALHDFSAVWLFFLLVLPLIHIAGSMFGFAQISVVRLVLVGMTAIWMACSKHTARLRRIPRTEFGVAAFFLFCAANLTSAIRTLNVESVFRSITYLEPLLFFVLSYYIVRRDSTNLKRILRVVALGGIVVAFIGLIEMQQQRSIFDLLGIHLSGSLEDFGSYLELNRFGLGGRISSTIGQPVYAGMYFVIWLMVSTGYILIYMPASTTLLFVLVPTGSLLILATGSRAPVAALAAALFVLVLASRSKATTAVQIGLSAAILSGLIYFAAPQLYGYARESLSTEYSPATANVLARVDLTTRLLEIFRDNPVLGYGPGLVQKAAMQGSPEFAGLGGLENQYAVILADGGLLAGMSYVIFMIATVRSLLRVRSTASREVRRGALVVLLLFTFHFVVIASVTSITSLPNEVLMALFGAIVAASANDREQRPAWRA